MAHSGGAAAHILGVFCPMTGCVRHTAGMVTAAEVSSLQFSQTKFREGYNVQQVDALLERIRVALENIEQRPGSPVGLTAADVLGARFSVTRFRAGYDQDEVDKALDSVITTLREAQG